VSQNWLRVFSCSIFRSAFSKFLLLFVVSFSALLLSCSSFLMTNDPFYVFFRNDWIDVWCCNFKQQYRSRSNGHTVKLNDLKLASVIHFLKFHRQHQCTLQLVWGHGVFLVCEMYSVMYIEIALSRKPFGIGHICICIYIYIHFF
jgi:hypothetical protein